MARATIYSKEIFDEIFEIIQSTQNGIATILKSDERFPSPSVFYDWLSEDESLQEKYARAKDMQMDLLVDQILIIADRPLKGKKVVSGTRIDRNGNRYEFSDTHEGDNVERARLMVDARKWVAAHLAPKKYGSKVDVTSGGKPIEAPPTQVIFKNPNAASEVEEGS